MDITSKKLSLIEWVIALNDQRVISELDEVRKRFTSSPAQMNPLSYRELFEKLQRSAADYESGNYLTAEALEEEIKSW